MPLVVMETRKFCCASLFLHLKQNHLICTCQIWRCGITSMAAKAEIIGALSFLSLPNAAHLSGIKHRIFNQIPLEDWKKETSFSKIIHILKEVFAKVKEVEN